MAGRYTAESVIVGGTAYDAGTSEADLTAAVEATLPSGAKADLGHIAWTDQAGAASVDPDGPPPKTGRGSGKGAWADYADEQGVTVDADATRDDIIEALEAAGKRTE